MADEKKFIELSIEKYQLYFKIDELNQKIIKNCDHPLYVKQSEYKVPNYTYYRCTKCDGLIGFHNTLAHKEQKNLKICEDLYPPDPNLQHPNIDYSVLAGNGFKPALYYNKDQNDSYRDGFITPLMGGRRNHNPFDPEYGCYDEILRQIWDRGFTHGQEYLRR